ncbi:hypothetical protein KIN20_014308 [Parelaphostrongylus tenuis]|uniref:Uncharacterized protein n=1 Tax=Parelaphostrongylus tenuis TaxID=148309 RepID=A0AAD5QN96_PARTN|nr:hypothetical protein KIN20_014308 [Parelaphostrongylus tenuis]
MGGVRTIELVGSKCYRKLIRSKDIWVVNQKKVVRNFGFLQLQYPSKSLYRSLSS